MTHSATTATAPSTHESAGTPRTWSFTSSVTGEQVAITCMPGCTIDHTRDAETPSHPVDIYCWIGESDDVTLPIDTTGTPEEFRVLSSRIEVHPFARALSHRLPFAVVEVVDEHWIGGLDPDGLEMVINTLAERLDALRRTHADLVRARADYAAEQVLSALRQNKAEVTA
ncbi:DUF6907 domain-containing protein [Streptomyces cylindrosporus]|uniref:Uncharacterized protein n=1 Tax=Streptomyces cylindrosporus TaxID=2927583 RepID=A0ABS9Y4I1_9ACTN|nr:hypothetical protein [Streptomyces cylindrosporus]MCI3272120.1 hypothetical protein [Streptomyces cylindrosporus]